MLGHRHEAACGVGTTLRQGPAVRATGLADLLREDLREDLV